MRVGKIRLRAGIFIVLFVFVAVYIIPNWYYLPLLYEGYGRNFNDTRISIGQPIIEDYFFPKFDGGKRRQIWLTPDSIKAKQLHRTKNYNTEKGELIYEADFYVYETDSLSSVLKRNYYYKKDSLSFELTLKINDQIIKRDTLEIDEADSLISSWKKF